MRCEPCIANITSGGIHACAVKTNGTGYCWGYNGYDALGFPASSGSQSNLPVLISGLSNISRLDSGVDSAVTCAIINTTGALYCWGHNDNRQLANGSTADSASPVLISSGVMLRATGGGGHVCDLVANNAVFCWGENYDGQVGDGNFNSPAAPTSPFSQNTTAQIVAGGAFTCARKLDGSLQCWGANYSGELGRDPSSLMNSAFPLMVFGANTIASVSVGHEHACAVKVDGSLVCWGKNEAGELGADPASMALSPNPVQVFGAGTTISVATGLSFSCAIKTDHSLWCWGINDYGQLGTNPTATPHSFVPLQVLSPGSTVDVATGNRSACAMKSDGSVVCWGANDFGQLGTNSQATLNPAPMPIALQCP